MLSVGSGWALAPHPSAQQLMALAFGMWKWGNNRG